jgi:hypothetical protein
VTDVTHMSPRYVTSEPHGKQALQERIAELETENEALREALREEWKAAHDDHCGSLPHPPGRRCYWPPPEVLGGDGGAA